MTPAAFDRGGDDERIADLRRELMQQARVRVDAARGALAAPHGFAATRVRIAQAQATALERGGYVARGAAREPLPLELLWFSWCTRPRSGSTA